MNETALQGFVKIVEMESFSEAADALFMSQSALSQQIRALEKQLKVELFRHTRRQVILTPAGQEFYPKARHILELYQEAVLQAQAVELKEHPPKRHLLIGYQNTALEMLGYDLFAATETLSSRYSPLMHRCTNRKDIWRSLLNGTIDLSLQIECAEITAMGLRFTPAVYVPEFGVPFHTPAEVPRGQISLEQAMQYRWMFAAPPEQSLYETALLQEAAAWQGEVIRNVKTVKYELPSVMWMPGVYYRRPDPERVLILDWKKGMRFGIVTKADPEPVVQAYVQELQQTLPQLSCAVFGLELEAAEE